MPPRDKAAARAAPRRGASAPPASLSREQKLQLYYWMRLTRTLEERLVALSLQGRVAGEPFRALGQEADSVGAAAALELRDVISPLVRSLGALLVRGVTPAEVLRQYVGAADVPSRGRARDLRFGDLDRGFIGQFSPQGDMVAVMAGVTLSFRLRGEDRVGLVFAGDGAMGSGTFHEGLNFAALHKCPLVVVVENERYAHSSPAERQSLAQQFADKAAGYGVNGEQADANDVLAVHAAARRAVNRARAGEGGTLLELITYRRSGHAEAGDPPVAPEAESERGAAENDPVDRYARVLTGRERVDRLELGAIDERVSSEVEMAAALVGVNAPGPV